MRVKPESSDWGKAKFLPDPQLRASFDLPPERSVVLDLPAARLCEVDKVHLSPDQGLGNSGNRSQL